MLEINIETASKLVDSNLRIFTKLLDYKIKMVNFKLN
jgi:hypothetical protein